jgi:hypothetical protein
MTHILNTRSVDSPATMGKLEIKRNRVAAVNSEIVCPLTSIPFPSSVLTTCRCSDNDSCGLAEGHDGSEVQSTGPSAHTVQVRNWRRGEGKILTRSAALACSGVEGAATGSSSVMQKSTRDSLFLVVNIFGFIAAKMWKMQPIDFPVYRLPES